MRKSLIITLTAALLLAAVLCTAGCVDTKTVDPAVGDWYSDENDTLIVFSVYENGNGAYIAAKAKNAGSGGKRYVTEEESTFVWAKHSDGTYLFSFTNGEQFTAVVNAQRGILTLNDDREFQKMTSAISGSITTKQEGIVLVQKMNEDLNNDNVNNDNQGVNEPDNATDANTVSSSTENQSSTEDQSPTGNQKSADSLSE